MYWAQLGSKTAGTTLPGVNATNLAKVKIPLPPIPTQRRSQNQSKQQIEDMFGALMQKAFRGEI